MKKLLPLIMLTISCSVVADNARYKGYVNRISLLRADGSFIVTVDSTALDDCKFKYAYFEVTRLGEARTKAAYEMALVSLTAHKKFGVVIDKEANGAGGICYAAGMTADIISQ